MKYKDLFIQMYLNFDSPENIKLSPKEIEEVFQEAIEFKLLPMAYQYLSRTHTIPDYIKQEFEEYLETRQIIRSILLELPKNQSAILVKGLATESYYPSNIMRYFHDIDFVIEDLTSFWNLILHLQENGMKRTTVLEFAERMNPARIIGGARLGLIKPQGKMRGVELQLGLLQIKSTSYIPWDVLSVSPQSLALEENHTIPMPSPGNLFLVYLAEIIQNDYVLLRDLFDITSILSQEKQIDIAHIVENIRTYKLKYGLYKILKEFHHSPSFPMPQLLTELLAFFPELEHTELNLIQHHIIPFILEHASNPSHQITYAFARDYTDKLIGNGISSSTLSKLKQVDQIIGASLFFKNGEFVYCQEIDNLPSPHWEWIRVADHDILLTPIGRFAIRMNALLSEQDLKEIQGLLHNNEQ